MFLWDYILTFEMEVDLVWKSKGNFMKGLYLFQRYLPFTELILFVLFCESDVVLSSRAQFFFFTGHMGGVPTKTMCREVLSANGGS